MATIRAVPGAVEHIRRLIEEDNKTHEEVSEELKHHFPGLKGFSSASVKRVCREENIHRTSRLTVNELDTVVRRTVAKVSCRRLS